MSWRRILLFTLAFAALLGAATAFLLQRTSAVTDFVRDELAALLRPRIRLDGASIDALAGRVVFAGLTVADPARAGEDLLRVERAQCEVELDPFGSLLAVRAVEIEGLRLQFGPELPTPEQLLAAPPNTGAATAAPRLPPIRLRRGEFLFTLRPGARPVAVRDLDLQILPVEADPDRISIVGTGAIDDLAAVVHLQGAADVREGELDVSLTLRDVALDARTWHRAEELFGVPMAQLEASCRMREFTARLRLSRHGEPTGMPRLQIAGELRAVRARLPGVPYTLRNAAVRFQASDLDGGSATLHFEQSGENGAVAVEAHARALDGQPDLDLRVRGTDIAIDAEVLALLESIPVGRRVVSALQPTSGRANLDLFLRNPQTRGGLAELDLDLRDVSMAYHGFGDPERRVGFPLPLVQAKGRVRLREDVIRLDGVEAVIASHPAAGRVRLTGTVDTNRPPGEDATLDIEAEAVPFDAELRAALTTLLRDGGELYDRLAPEGRTDVEVLVRPRSLLAGGWAVSVRPQLAAVRWAGFPYRLDQVRGTVVAREEGVTFDLEGRNGDGTLSMQGRIPLADSTDERLAGFEAQVRLQAIAIDEPLRAAVAVVVPEISPHWQACAPTGRLSGEVRVWRPRPTDPLHHDLRLVLDGVHLALPAAPWTADALHGQLFAQGVGSDTRIDFDALRGTLGHDSAPPAQLAMLGSIQSGPEFSTDLTFVVRDLVLDDQLGTTLGELRAIGPGTWTSLRPSGLVDLVCRHRHPAADGSELALVVQLVDVASDAPMLPRPARRMTGELTVAGGVLRFADLRADMGGAEVRARNGSVRTLPAPDLRTELAFEVESTSFPVDSGLANLFAEPLGSAVRERQLSGRADVDGLRLRFLLPNADDELPFETTIAGQLRLDDVSVLLGTGREALRVDSVTGYVTIDESSVSARSGGLRGTMQDCSMVLMRHRLTALSAGFTADAERLVLHSLAASMDGGILRNADSDSVALDYTLPGPVAPRGRLAANFEFERVDVYSFLDQSGWTNPPYSGTASGRVRLDRLDGNDLVDAECSGELRIERADLGVVPLFTAIYAQLPAPERPRFDRLQSSFSLRDRRVEFAELSLWSNLLAAQGKGTMGLDGYLDIELKLDSLLGPSADPVLIPLVTFFTQNIVRFHLFGFLRDLRAEKRWVTERSPRRQAIVPMPPHTERPVLPDY